MKLGTRDFRYEFTIFSEARARHRPYAQVGGGSGSALSTTVPRLDRAAAPSVYSRHPEPSSPRGAGRPIGIDACAHDRRTVSAAGADAATDPASAGAGSSAQLDRPDALDGPRMPGPPWWLDEERAVGAQGGPGADGKATICDHAGQTVV